MTLHEIARLLGAEITDQPDIEIAGVAGLDDAEPGQLSFLTNPRYAGKVASTRASAVLLDSKWDGKAPCPVLKVSNVDAAFSRLAEILAPVAVTYSPGIHPTTIVDPTAEVADDCSIGPYCVIGAHTRVGRRTVLVSHCHVGEHVMMGDDGFCHSFVNIRERVTIGDRVILHTGASIGDDGFGFVPTETGWDKIPQVGTVIIGNDVEIGSNSCVDRARFGKTVIGDGVKLDNLVQIAHNVVIGKHTAMAALGGISGSTKIGEHCLVGGQAGFNGHLDIGDGVMIHGRSLVTKDIPESGEVSGEPARPHRENQKQQAYVKQVPTLKKQMADLTARLAALEDHLV